jgi:hypothetical protein
MVQDSVQSFTVVTSKMLRAREPNKLPRRIYSASIYLRNQTVIEIEQAIIAASLSFLLFCFMVILFFMFVVSSLSQCLLLTEI